MEKLKVILGPSQTSNKWILSFYALASLLENNPDGANPTTGLMVKDANAILFNKMTELIVCESILHQGRGHVLRTLSSMGVDLEIFQEIRSTFHMLPRATVGDLVTTASQIANIVQVQQVVRECVTRVPTPALDLPTHGNPIMSTSSGIGPTAINFGTVSPMTPPRAPRTVEFTPVTPAQSADRVNKIMGDMARDLLSRLNALLLEQIREETLWGHDGVTINHISDAGHTDTESKTPKPEVMRNILTNMKLVPAPVYNADMTIAMNFVVFLEYAQRVYSLEKKQPIKPQMWGPFILALGTFFDSETTLRRTTKDKTIKVHTPGVTIMEVLAKTVLKGSYQSIMEDERFSARQCKHLGKPDDYRCMYATLEDFETHTDAYHLILEVMAHPVIATSALCLTGVDTDTTWMIKHAKSHILGPTAQAMAEQGNATREGYKNPAGWIITTIAWLREMKFLQPAEEEGEEHKSIHYTHQQNGRRSNNQGKGNHNQPRGHKGGYNHGRGESGPGACWKFERGDCRWGDDCKFKHGASSNDGNQRNGTHRSNNRESHRGSRERRRSRSPPRNDRRHSWPEKNRAYSPRNERDRSDTRRDNRSPNRTPYGQEEHDRVRSDERKYVQRPIDKNVQQAQQQPAQLGSLSRPNPGQRPEDNVLAPNSSINRTETVHPERRDQVPGARDGQRR